MKFGILGSLEAESGSGRLRLGGPCEHKLLAGLLLEADRVVPLARLVDVLWDDRPPATARKQVRNAVSRLRRVLTEGGAPGLVVTHGAGYLLTVDADALDALMFEALVAQAGLAASAGHIAEAARSLNSALDLWRGPFLAGMTGRVIDAAAAAWQERRCAAMETFYDHQLTLGRQADAIAGLQAFATEHPLRDKPAGQLMLALYRCGRQAEALALYRRTRAVMAAELGLDPGPDLQLLHQQILTGDPALTAQPLTGRRERATAALVPPAVPRQLPRAAGDFVGRACELEALAGLLEQAGGARGTVLISAIGGMAGIGKTALALHFAHLVAARFPDGQLYVNLRGFDPGGSPMTPGEAVRGFLDAFEIPVERIPVTLDAQAGLYRSLLAGRRVLVVLDNARDAGQVRPLLPGSPGCVVVVTSRSRLTSLIADGAHPLTLDLLTQEEACQLLASRIGGNRIAAEPQAAQQIIALCARLPLALTVVATRAAVHPRFPLAALAAELRDIPQPVLDGFDGGDPATDVRAVFSWSYQQLTAPAARLFRLLGHHSGPDISAAAAASLAAVPRPAVRSLLAELARAHLVTEHAPGRFACHDLLRAYAAELTRTTDSMAGQRAAAHRILDHYLHTAHAAALLLYPAPLHRPITLSPPCAGAQAEQFADATAAWAWFEAERHVLLAAIQQAAATGWETHGWQLPCALRVFFERRGRWHDLAATQHTALTAARSRDDPQGQALAHLGIGGACGWLGRHEEARAHLQQALTLFAELGDQAGQATSHSDLGWILRYQDRPVGALHHAQQALNLYRAVGHRRGQAGALNNVGWSHTLLGNYQQALACCEEAHALFAELGDRFSEAVTLDSIGYASHHLGRHHHAAACYQRALTLFQEHGDRYYEASVLDHLGDSLNADSHPTAACAAWQQALDILDQLGHSEAGQIRAKLRRPISPDPQPMAAASGAPTGAPMHPASKSAET